MFLNVFTRLVGGFGEDLTTSGEREKIMYQLGVATDIGVEIWPNEMATETNLHLSLSFRVGHKFEIVNMIYQVSSFHRENILI